MAIGSATSLVLVLVCGAVAGSVLVVSCTGSTSEQPGAGRTPDPPAAASDVPEPDPCTIRVAGAEVTLTEAEAIEITDLAARSVRATKPSAPSVAGLAARLASVDPVAADNATATARALLGHDGPALTCAYPRAGSADADPAKNGLTPRATQLLSDMNAAFGAPPTGGYASGGVESGHVNDSSHYEGRAIDVFFRPRTERAQNRRGWAAAQWLVARGSQLSVLSVIYRDRIWTVWASSAGWRNYVHPSGNTKNPILRHLDHVHTAVVGGDFRRDA